MTSFATSVDEAAKLADTPEAAAYLALALKRNLNKWGLDRKVVDGILAVENWASNIEKAAQSISDPWRGQLPIDKHRTLQTNLAFDAIERINRKGVVFDFSLSDANEFIRGFSSEGKALDQDAVAAMDDLFHSWLAEQHMVCQSGVIYEADASGKIKQDKSGSHIKPPADKVRTMLSGNMRDSFSAYVEKTAMKKTNESIKIEAVQHPYGPQESTQAQTGR